MDKRSERILALAAVISLIWFIVDAVLVSRTHLLVLPAVLPYVALAAGLCLFVLMRVRLARLAEQEKRDQALARQEQTEAALFEHEPGKFEPFTVGRSHEQFERWVVPAAGLVLAVAGGSWAWHIWRGLMAPANPPTDRLLAAALLAGETFTMFLFSRYLLGLSRVRPVEKAVGVAVEGGTQVCQAESVAAGETARTGQAGSLAETTRSGQAGSLSYYYRLLRGPGVMLGIVCFVSLLALVAAVAGEMGLVRGDRLAALGLAGFLGLLAVENVMTFIGDLYRPRRGRELSRSYESRLGGLLTDPATWVRNVAGALDYQFGYKVSESWLYRFLEQALLPLVLFQLLVLYLLSTLVFLGPEEEAIVERFGRPRAGDWHWESGVHVKWPWPFEIARRYPVKQILRTQIGFNSERAAIPSQAPNVVVWTVPHYTQEDQFLTASQAGGVATNQDELSVPVNLMAFNVAIEYRILDLYRYAYSCADPQKALEAIAYRSLTLEAASRGLFDVMSEGRAATARAMQARMQREADQLGLGIEVVFVGLLGVHPPVSVADAFESVIGATEESEAAILKARADANRILPVAAAEAVKVGADATAYAVRRTAISAAEADQFLKRLDGYHQSPAVFKSRFYLRALTGALVNARKYIVAAAPGREVVQIDFTEKLRPDLFDFGPPAKAAAEKK